MNLMALDYGTKRVGVAVAIMGIITPLEPIQNNEKIAEQVLKLVGEYRIEKVFVGLCEGDFAQDTLKFVENLEAMLKLPVETVEEAVSTIEATDIYLDNKRKKKKYKSSIDSVAAAVILRRAIG